jgi:hypothetical protein
MTDIDLSDLAADRDGSRPLRGYLASPAGTARVGQRRLGSDPTILRHPPQLTIFALTR